MLQSDQNKVCACHDNGLCLDNRHLSWLLVGVIVLSFGFFMTGFFMGKQKAVQDLRVTLDQNSLADKIYTSLCTAQDSKMVVARQEEDAIDSAESPEAEYRQSVEADAQVVSSPEVEASVEEAPTGTPEREVDTPKEQYFAQLVGFGTQQAAQKFAQRLQQKDMPVEVKDRHSKTAKGKKVTWYQVVTTAFNNKGELEKVVDEIKGKERLKDVRILTC